MQTLFVAGGQILATDAIRAAYHEGRGSIPMRGTVSIEGDIKANEEGGGNGNGGTTTVKAGKAGKGKTHRKRGEGKPAVVITELPYQTNKVCKMQATATSMAAHTQSSLQMACLSAVNAALHLFRLDPWHPSGIGMHLNFLI